MLALLLTLHIFFAVWLMSHLIGSAFWKARAEGSGNPETVASTARALVRSDLTFMAPGIVGLLATGIWMGGITGWERFQELWLTASFLLTILLVVLWLVILMPQQRRMARCASAVLAGEDQEDQYRRASKMCSIVGGIATLIPVVVLFLMVFKP